MKIKVFLSLMLIYTIWGSTYLAMKVAIHDYPPYLMSGIRFFLAGLLFLFFLMFSRKFIMPTVKQWINSFVIGSLFFGGGTGLVGYAQIWVTSSAASMAVAIIPIWICLLSLLSKDYPSKRELIGVFIGFIGIIILNKSSQVSVEPMGAILLFFAPLLWAIGTILSRKLELPEGAMRTVAQLLMGGLTCIILSILINEPWYMPPAETYFSVLYLVIFGSLIAFTAYNYLLANASPVLATSYAFVNPLFAAVLGIMAGESWSAQLSLALCLICLGVIFVIYGRKISS